MSSGAMNPTGRPVRRTANGSEAVGCPVITGPQNAGTEPGCQAPGRVLEGAALTAEVALQRENGHRHVIEGVGLSGTVADERVEGGVAVVLEERSTTYKRPPLVLWTRARQLVPARHGYAAGARV